MNHIMLDLETLDTSSSAVVLSIGAVAFDPYTDELGDRFYVEMTDDISTQQACGRTISGDTVCWWMRQSVVAKRVFSAVPSDGVERACTLDALTYFTRFVEANGGTNIELWGNGADFDNIILGTLYDAFALAKPWYYSHNRCYRTMKNLGIGPRRPQSRDGVHHNALDDAITQARHLQEIFACLKPR